MSKKANDALRASYVAKLINMLKADEDVLRVDSNKIAIPVIDCEGEDSWVIFTVTVPTGSRDGDIYDGYSESEAYALKMVEKEAKAKEDEVKKAAKIARDKKAREQKAAAKAAYDEEKA